MSSTCVDSAILSAFKELFLFRIVAGLSFILAMILIYNCGHRIACNMSGMQQHDEEHIEMVQQQGHQEIHAQVNA